MKLDDAVTTLSGVGKEVAKRLARLEIKTVSDLIQHYPRRYDDFSRITSIRNLKPGQVTLKGKIRQAASRQTRRNFKLTEAIIDDATGSVKAVWFNQPYLAKQLPRDTEVYVSGELEFSYNQYALQNPVVEPVSSFPKDTARIVPIYPETDGLTSRQIRGLIRQVLPAVENMRETLPAEVVTKEKLLGRAAALVQVHFPDSTSQLQQARYRLAFEELFWLILTGLVIKAEVKAESSPAIAFDEEAARAFVSALSASWQIKLTDAQRRAAWQILQDMQGTPNRSHRTGGATSSAGEQAGAVRTVRPMNRLLEGDVGSGKTVVAMLAAHIAANAGYQTALMVPTEVLARQHFKRLEPLLSKLGVRAALVVGGNKTESKQSILDEIAGGKADVVIGTHALIQSDIDFNNLGLVVIDEQHRFGVQQRQALKRKAGRLPHLLSMTATPIPRSLALTVYGDLDVSLIDELPPGRKPVKTQVASLAQRAEVYQHIDNEIGRGRQVFVVCPLISESDPSTPLRAGKLGAKSVEEEAERLRASIFKHRRIAVMHGRLRPDDKQKTMEQFVAGDIDLLVSTTVIEVGVDIPNATVMLIEGAERFGLATLHQLRGRVGRSTQQAYCYLLATVDQQALRRLRLLEKYNDGFRLAQEDLKLRGPGQIYGTRQHGLLELKIADVTDVKLVSKVRGVALEFFKDKQHMVQYPSIVKRINKLKTVTTLD